MKILTGLLWNSNFTPRHSNCRRGFLSALFLRFTAQPNRSRVFQNRTNIASLICAGANLDAVTTYQWTALYWATFKGHTDIAQALIDAGADVDASDKQGTTVLTEAIIGGRKDIEHALITAGAAQAR